jgi:predicted Zn-ribbon and HTH transcriptional regulator
MAEGWAKEWIQSHRKALSTQLQTIKRSTNDDLTILQEKISLLDKTIIASVALDASAVFQPAVSSSSPQTATTKTPSLTRVTPSSSQSNFTDTNSLLLQRKSIKTKAIEAMKSDGIDISTYVPKTVDEVIPMLLSEEEEEHNGSTHHQMMMKENEEKDDETLNHIYPINSVSSSSSSSTSPSIPSSCQKCMEEKVNEDYEDHQEDNITKATSTTTTTTTASNTTTTTIANEEKNIDKLIVLCSCGDELKHNLIRVSKSVEEWLIDPPTTASKNGEGDGAYRRVSLEIREEVDKLMNGVFHDVLVSSGVGGVDVGCGMVQCRV